MPIRKLTIHKQIKTLESIDEEIENEIRIVYETIDIKYQ